jgi:hypothetical protein
VARHPARGKTHEQIREHLLAILVGGLPGPIGGSPSIRRRVLDLRRTDTAGR